MQSGGGVTEVCVCVEEEEGGGILWDACPLILCVCARACGVCVVCEGEKEETASCAHAALYIIYIFLNTEIYLNVSLR